MTTLPVTPIELVSVQRTVPFNGSPTSQDYNDDQNNALVDLTSLTSFINDVLIPLLQVLPASAATAGLEGRAVNTDSSNLSALCFNQATSTPLTIAQSLQYLQNLQASLQGTVTDLSTQVAVLSSKLSSTNQNDISLALQNFQSVVNQLSAQFASLQSSFQSASTHETLQTVTPLIAALAESSVVLTWPTAFADDAYTVMVSIEDSTGSLQIDSWAYVSGGGGITVSVTNTDHSSAHTGTIHAVGFPS